MSEGKDLGATASMCGCGCGGEVKTPGARFKRGHHQSATPVDRRVWDFIEKTDSCWLWTGHTTQDGYGRIRHGAASPTPEATHIVHRLVYEQLVGPIPEGMVLDHICRVRNCVNPKHLEPVTNAENLRRTTAQRDRHVELRLALEDASVALGRAIPRVPSGLRPALQRAWDGAIDALEGSRNG